jgi:hypothetical protein
MLSGAGVGCRSIPCPGQCLSSEEWDPPQIGHDTAVGYQDADWLSADGARPIHERARTKSDVACPDHAALRIAGAISFRAPCGAFDPGRLCERTAKK